LTILCWRNNALCVPKKNSDGFLRRASDGKMIVKVNLRCFFGTPNHFTRQQAGIVKAAARRRSVLVSLSRVIEVEKK